MVLVAGASLPALAVLPFVALPAFASFAALGLTEAEAPLPFPFSAAFLPFGFFAGATFVVAASSSFFDFLGGFESWKWKKKTYFFKEF